MFCVYIFMLLSCRNISNSSAINTKPCSNIVLPIPSSNHAFNYRNFI